MKKVYLPTQASKLRCLVLLILVIFIYLVENTSIASFLGSGVFIYYLKGILWLGIAFVIWLFPRIRFKAKLKLQSFIDLWAFNFGVLFIIVSVAAGFIDGFGKSPYSHSLKGIIANVLTVVIVLIGKEFFRHYVINTLTKEENYFLFILISLLMTFLNTSLSGILSLKGYENTVIFIAQNIAPEFSKNLMATYFVFAGGPLPSILYLGVIEGFEWLSPILPNLKWITTALVGVLCPVFSLITFQNLYGNEARLIKKQENEKEKPFSWIITSVVSIALIWFVVGMFPIYPSVIATGSMEPMIMPGDAILVQKVKSTDELKVGDVIQFKRDNILISHRIIEKVKNDNIDGFRTKGDNNSASDGGIVKPEDIKGKIIKVVPKIGWPTLLIKSRHDVPLEKVQF